MGEGSRGWATRRLTRTVGASEGGRRLVDVLADWLSAAAGTSVSRARVRAAIVGGAVRIDGAPARLPGRLSRAGERVEVALKPDALKPKRCTRDRDFCLSAQRILFRDQTLIAVDKPAGLPTHATADPGRPHLVRHVQELLVREGRLPYVAVHQRLDRDTSGVVLFAIDRAVNGALARAFADGQVEKTYLALTRRPAVPPRQRFRVQAPLGSADKRGRVPAGVRDGQTAETEFEVRQVLGSALLIEARPKTGRKHQIRAHLAFAGLPILGDDVYGEPRSRSRGLRLMLHAWRLSLPHPISGQRLSIESPFPEDFRQAVEQARRSRSRLARP